jgi:hypothetical protein
MSSLRTKNRYRYVNGFVGSDGRVRFYFRRKGCRAVRLPGLIDSPEFVLAHTAALNEPLPPPLPPLSSLPGGVVARRGGKNPNAVQSLIGVYMLLLKGRVVYVGSSLNMPKRVAEHRSNCRPFDQAFYIATIANQREALERVLIRAINPSQNRQHV